jgi:imidazolonepropionase-like amidohydrolase
VTAPPVGALHVRGVLLPAAEPVELWVHEGRVTYEKVAGAETVASGWIAPGLVDMHCHLGLGPGGVVDDAETEKQALADRDTGVLLARDCGSAADTRWMDDRPDLPRVVRAGRHLARTRRYVRGYAVEVEPGELAGAAAVEAGRGDGWVKLVGDWIDRDVGALTESFPADAVAAAVAAAHAAGARVTTHVFGRDALVAALDAGIDCIEHGTALDDELISRMAAAGTALVPTLLNVVENFPGIADSAARFPAYAEHMRRMHTRAPGAIRAAYEAGVPLYVGTDAGGVIEHGRIADEVRVLHEAGIPLADLTAAATWRARDYLGRPGLDEGDPADLVVFAADPRAHLSAWAAPARVVLRGRVVA